LAWLTPLMSKITLSCSLRCGNLTICFTVNFTYRCDFLFVLWYVICWCFRFMPIFELMCVMWSVFLVVNFMFVFKFTDHYFLFPFTTFVGLAGYGIELINCILSCIIIILINCWWSIFQFLFIFFLDIIKWRELGVVYKSYKDSLHFS